MIVRGVHILHRPAMHDDESGRFAAERVAAWEELEAALRRAGDRPEKLGPDGVRRPASSTARRRPTWRSRAARSRASRWSRGSRALVLRGARYGLCTRGAAWVAVVVRCRAGTGGGWPSGRARCWPPGCCCSCRPGWARSGGCRRARRGGPDPGEFQSAADPPAEGRDYDAATASAFSVQVMFNNIQVTLIAFAGGITFGVLTVSRCSSTG